MTSYTSFADRISANPRNVHAPDAIHSSPVSATNEKKKHMRPAKRMSPRPKFRTDSVFRGSGNSSKSSIPNAITLARGTPTTECGGMP